MSSKSNFNLKINDFPKSKIKDGNFIFKNNQPDEFGFFTVVCSYKNKLIGEALFRHQGSYIRGLTFREASMIGRATYVLPEYQKQGICSKMYLFASKITCRPIKQSECTEEGQALWNSLREKNLITEYMSQNNTSK